jgi:hypothetical protein
VTIRINIDDFYTVIHFEDNSERVTGTGRTFNQLGKGDPDRIDVSIFNNHDIIKDQVRIGLLSHPPVTWHKEIKAIGFDNQTMASVFTQDNNRGLNSMVVDVSFLKSLIFNKAKLFGAHTDMYELGNLQSYGGLTLLFEWKSD